MKSANKKAGKTDRVQALVSRLASIRKRVWGHVDTLLKQMTQYTLVSAVACAHEAVSNDGTIMFNGSEGDEKKWGLLEVPKLRNSFIILEGISSHSVFAVSDRVRSEPKFTAASQRMALFKQVGEKVFAVLECAILRGSPKHRELHSERTWTAKDLAAILDGKPAELLEPLVPSATLQQFASLVDVVAHASANASREVIPAIRILVDICAVDHGGVSEDQVSDLVGKMPKCVDDPHLKELFAFCKRFLQATGRH